MEVCYLLSGEEVILHGKIGDQFVVEGLLIDDEGEEYPSGEKIFVDKIFDKPLTEKINKEIINLKEESKCIKNEIARLNKEKEKLKSEILDIEKLSFLKNLNKVNDIEYFIKTLGFKPISNFEIKDKDFHGYNNRYKYASLIYKYYDNKKEILDLFDFLNIEVDNKYKNMILPKDMDISKVRELLKNEKFIKTNSCYLHNNENFFIETEYGKEYPLQEILKHKDILSCFDLLLGFYTRDYSKYDAWEFDTIVNMSEKEINLIIESIIKKGKVNKIDKVFIKRHKDLIFNNDNFCENAFKYIEDDSYSGLYVANFPLKYQIRYFKNKGIQETIRFLSSSYNYKNFEEGYLEKILIEICSSKQEE